jgi:hypothetical protein
VTGALPGEADPLSDFGGAPFPLLGTLWRVTILSASLGWIDPEDPDSMRELAQILEEDLPDSAGPAPRVTRRIDPRDDTPAAVPRVHPLRSVRRYLRQQVSPADIDDYRCVVMRQERVFGQLRPREFLHLEVRRAPARAPGAWRTESVRVRYLAPASLRGTEILQAAAAGSDRLYVGDPGGRWRAVEPASSDSYLLPPSRQTAARITLAGLGRRLLAQIDTALQVDPLAVNTSVRAYTRASVDGRPCLRIQLHHPQWQQGLRFCRTEMYYDQQRHLPLRVERYDWPRPDQTALPLLEQYTYMDVEVNVGLTDDEFLPPSPAR